MKKLLTLVAALAITVVAVQAQCVPDPQFPNSGIYPTPVDGIADGEVGVPYAQVLTVNIPNDTTIDLSSIIGFPVPPVTVTINLQTVDTLNGLPPGLSYACTPMTCEGNAGTSFCLEISGTPTTAGQYVFNLAGNLNITVPAQVPVIGGSQQDIPTPLAYNMDVQNSTSINPAAQASFSLEQNLPNPFSGQTEIRFYAPTISDFTLDVVNLKGQRVFRQNLNGVSGSQRVVLDASDFAPGLYFYSLSDGQARMTRKLVVME